MVVGQHHAGGVERQRAHHHLARVDAGLRQGAAEQLFQRDQPVLAVEKQHGKNFMRPAAELQLQIVTHGLRCGEQGFFLQLFGQGAAGQLQHGHQFGAFGRAQALDAFERFGAGVQQTGHAAKGVHQLLAHLQGIFAGQASAQQQRQQFGVTERAGAAGQQFFAWAGIQGQVFQEHERLWLRENRVKRQAGAGKHWFLPVMPGFLQ
ncbi:hypothetical protein D9M73_93040 [compost metagenome]